MNPNNIRQIIKSIVTGYDKIALKFHHTRISFFRDLKFVKNYVSEDSAILDFGCGNGRLVDLLEKKYRRYLGLDASEKLIEIAKGTHGNEDTLFQRIKPFQKLSPYYNSFDLVFSIAVFHHFPGKKYRLERAKELHKTLRKNGKIIISVWNLWQKKYFLGILREWFKILFMQSSLDWKDLNIPFKTEEFTFYRYHHAFTKNELKNLFKKAGFKTLELRNTGRNLVYIGRKR